MKANAKSFSILKTSGNEVYYTASSLLVTLKNSCSKLHCQIFFKLQGCSYKICTRIVWTDRSPKEPVAAIDARITLTSLILAKILAAHMSRGCSRILERKGTGRHLLERGGEVEALGEVGVLAKPADELDHRDLSVAVRVQRLGENLLITRPA